MKKVAFVIFASVGLMACEIPVPGGVITVSDPVVINMTTSDPVRVPRKNPKPDPGVCLNDLDPWYPRYSNCG